MVGLNGGNHKTATSRRLNIVICVYRADVLSKSSNYFSCLTSGRFRDNGDVVTWFMRMLYFVTFLYNSLDRIALVIYSSLERSIDICYYIC